MPRVNECLAAKQIEPTTPQPAVAAPAAPPTPPGKPCTFGCTSFCVGPQCAGNRSLKVGLCQILFWLDTRYSADF